MNLHQLMDLKIDYAFKQLFGHEKNKHITITFLNALLNRPTEKRITHLEFNELEAIAMEDHVLKEAFDVRELLSADEEKCLQYESR